MPPPDSEPSRPPRNAPTDTTAPAAGAAPVLYVADELAAQAAAASARSAGWDVHVDTAADGAGWLVLAEQHDAATSPAAVRAARELFEGLAAAAPGGDYDGWEASL